MKPRIAWFSPFNDEENSGLISSYVTEKLVPELDSAFEIEIFHREDPLSPVPGASHFLTAWQIHERDPFDLFFYQLEDSPASAFVRMHLGLVPGVVWFHHFLFSNFGPEPILNSSWAETVSKYRDPSRPWPERGAEFTQHGPLGFREAGLSALPVFSNVSNHIEFRNQINHRLSSGDEKLLSSYLPLPVDFPDELVTRAKSSILNVGFCGTPHIESRAHKVFQALSAIENVNLLWLLSTEERDLAEELMREYGLSSVQIIEGRNPEKWREVVRQCDAAIHTLFSVYGQTGPYLETSLMFGLPVIVSNFAASDWLPDNIVFKIQSGDHEATEIQAAIQAIRGGKVLHDPKRVQTFARETFDTKVVAQELASIFRRAIPAVRPLMKRWEALHRDARQELLQETEEILLAAGAEEGSLLSADQIWTRIGSPVYQEFGWIKES